MQVTLQKKNILSTSKFMTLENYKEWLTHISNRDLGKLIGLYLIGESIPALRREKTNLSPVHILELFAVMEQRTVILYELHSFHSLSQGLVSLDDIQIYFLCHLEHKGTSCSSLVLVTPLLFCCFQMYSVEWDCNKSLATLSPNYFLSIVPKSLNLGFNTL